MTVATSLDRNACPRLIFEILRHHRCRAAQECEGANKHALVADRHQLRHAAAIGRGQDSNRIASGRPKQVGMSFARNLFAQTLAMAVALGARPPRGLAYLASHV